MSQSNSCELDKRLSSIKISVKEKSMVTENFENIKKSLLSQKTGFLNVFGYASLIWKPELEYENVTVGYIKGYKRRFYQGSVSHRGTIQWPGRVATIIKDETSIVWGVSYEIQSKENIDYAFKHLLDREINIGGYCYEKVWFQPYDDKIRPYLINVYVAEENNSLYMGSGGSLEIQAYQIVKASGYCGRNIEYVMKVAGFMEKEVTKNWKDLDPYLYKLVSLIQLYENGSKRPIKMLENSIE